MDDRMKLLEKIKIRLNGYLYVGSQMKEGWKEPFPLYKFKCPIHGYVQSRPKGYNNRLECPICSEIALKEENKNTINVEIE